MKEQIEVSIISACHNRKTLTKQMIESLFKYCPKDWKLDLCITDDGSTDGTDQILANYDRRIKVIRGTGDWYWAKSMLEAQKLTSNSSDAIMWINDDVHIFEHSLSTLASYHRKHPNAILVGQMSDSTGQFLTYGGLARNGRRPLSYRAIEAIDEYKKADTFNGNLVFIPKFARDLVGSIDGRFSHAYADLDYGLRAKKESVEIIVLPGFLGVCNVNSSSKSSSNIFTRVKEIHHPKHQPLKSQIIFLRRHCGIEWPLYLLSPYIRAIFGKNTSPL